ncbi:shTK domain protein [Ancylostoma caninum]|uniref:ShTK domain protein n=1 Tax=Ancylostoma caninum TaxID=29170 RepID=A0A368GGW8_ANCCA|nr:shTK domain protein [Ancylostoma caninum]
METLPLLLPLFFVYTTEAQLLDCSNGGIGPCIGGKCPAGFSTCINTAAGEMCCENTKIVVPTTAAPATTAATTTAAACVDKLNPKTGRSDCPNVAYLCNNAVYYTLMTDQCPKTCNRCGGSGAATTAAPPTAGPPSCRDLVDPRTGVSSCPQMASYCRDPAYVKLMRQQCPRTCGYCI